VHIKDENGEHKVGTKKNKNHKVERRLKNAD
jgi:hypothetical protein